MPMTDNCIRRCYGIVSFSRSSGSSTNFKYCNIYVYIDTDGYL